MFDSTAYTQGTNNNADTSKVLHSTTMAKQTSRGIRVWLENKAKLEHAGFYAGARYSIGPTVGGLMLVQCEDGEGRVSSCKRGDTVRPIIDLHSKSLASIFNAGTVLEVQYSAGAITIKAI